MNAQEQVKIYQTVDGQTQINIRFEQETVWLNRQQLAQLFDRDIKTIGKHINNVFKEGELQKDSVVAKYATTAQDGKTYQVDHYNLDALTLLVAESDPKQKETLIRLIMHMLMDD